MASRVGAAKESINEISFDVSVDSSSDESRLIVTDAQYLSDVSKLGFFGSPDGASCSFLVSSMSPKAVGEDDRLHSVYHEGHDPGPFPSLTPSVVPKVSTVAGL